MSDGSQQDQIPRLAVGWDPAGRDMSPAEGFLLSRIDGQTPWSLLLQVGGLTPDEVDGRLRAWIHDGIIGVPAGEAARADGEAKPEIPSARESGFEADIESELELPVELQREILEFDASLDRPYHQLLGVARDADSRAIKRAYFRLSKQFHPDRYFRREIGEFANRLDRIFNKIVEAYELLSDPTTRSEVERSMQHAPPPPSAGADVKDSPTTEPRVPSRLERLRRIRRGFQLPKELIDERQAGARNFYQAAMVSAKRERWLEAAASARLAIAFDPWCDEYKRGFAEVQSHVHGIRAAKLLEEAKGTFDDSARKEALHLYEEALAFRPRDAALNARAAQLALELNELDRAREYAEAACEACPDLKDYRVILAHVCGKQGLVERAMEAFKEAHRLDPKDDHVRAEMDALQRRGRRGRAMGGKR